MLESSGRLRYVNLLQGTDSHHGFSTGNTLPLVARPFGMNHWSAQTAEGGWFFSPHDRKLQGIRCTHQPSPWMGDYGHFTLMANTGREVHLSPGRRSRAYRGTFAPNRFRVELLNDGTVIEMSPTIRGAVFAFRFPVGGGRVVFEPCAGSSEIDFVDARTVTGWVNGNSGGVPEGFAHYFAIRFDRDVVEAKRFRGETVVEDRTGERLGFFAQFDGDVTVRIATSFISVEQAQRNLDQELAGHSLDEIAEVGRAEWEEALGRIEVSKEDENHVRTFYSCFYRTHLFPRIWHEETPEGRRHRSPYNGQVHDGPLYTDNGFWDTYRTMYPLLALLDPERLAEILQGWTNAYKEGGWFPQWASPGYRACMVGTHIDAVMADGIARGVTNFDVKTALEGLRKHADTVGDPSGAWGRIGIEDYQTKGFVSTDHHESVARALDYAYDDWCIGQIDPSFAGRERAGNYVHHWDPGVGFMRAKNADGTWLEPWDEFHWGNPYVEGGPWQSTWAVPHDAAALIRLMGGDEAFVAKLDRMLTSPGYFTTGAYGFEIHEMTEMTMGPMGQYAHSNQPVHHVLYLYNSAGRPWRTQKEVRRALTELYSPTHLPGDEDNGEMCAWFVLSSLGIYPLTPGHPSWTLGSPLFSQAKIHLPNGKTFTVDAPHNGSERPYVSETLLNGRSHADLFVSHRDLAEGGTLTFHMSDRPKTEVVEAKHRPFSASQQ